MRIGELVRYSTKIYRKSREMSVINHNKIVRDDNQWLYLLVLGGRACPDIKQLKPDEVPKLFILVGGCDSQIEVPSGTTVFNVRLHPLRVGPP